MLIDANGIRINYELSGKENGKVVVLSHSLGSSMVMWNPQLDVLEPHFRVLRYDMRGHGDSDASVGAYTLDQLMITRNILRCDAVLVGKITEYTPYPHMVIGLRLKMISLDDGRHIWAFEQVWDTADKKTEHRIKKFLANQTQLVSANMNERLVTISSIKFLKFVAYEVALTL